MINIFFILLISFFAFAENRLQISSTFSLDIPFKITNQTEIPSMHSKYIKLENNEVFITHTKPMTLANKFSAERYWKLNRMQTATIDKRESNLGCLKLSSRNYKCSRQVIQNDKFIFESVYWNANEDLVLVRVSSNKSIQNSKLVSDKIKVYFKSRIPAGIKK